MGHLGEAELSLLGPVLTCFFDVTVVVLANHDWDFAGPPISLMIVDDYLDSAGKYDYLVS